ncbi:MAG: hypothetical protein FJ272_03045, partial [Planctomycetes bacterium]|nr:hypothetical protein [Planctomycetota bacterium]
MKRLFALSGNRCAFPGCKQALVDEKSGVVTAEICHIKAESPGGPRYDSNQSDRERHGFANLILLCGDHHKVIDADPNTLTVTKLLLWKARHEKRWKGKPRPHLAPGMIRQILEQVTRPALNLIDPAVRIEQAKTRAGDELQLLNPYSQATRLVARDQDLRDLLAWAESDRPVAVRTLIGSAGAGKTRLALELMQRLQAGNARTGKARLKWHVGFLTPDEMERFKGQQNLADWDWGRPTLAVLDYAAASADVLLSWLKALAHNSRSLPRARNRATPPLRILLLERQATLDQGWLAGMGPGMHTGRPVTHLFDPQEPVLLSPIEASADRRLLLQNTLDLCAQKRGVPPPKLPPPGQDRLFDAHLQKEQWDSPLLLMMAGVVAIHTNVPDALSLSRTDLGEEVAKREIARIVKLCPGGIDRDVVCPLMVHLSACATLGRGLARDEALKMAKTVQEVTGRDYPGGHGRLVDALAVALPSPDQSIAPVVPDMVGEAVVYLAFASGQWPLSSSQRDEVLRATVRYRGSSVFKTLMLLIQDYAERWPQTLDWLETLIREGKERDFLLLLGLASELPDQTVVLREKA